MIPQPYQKTAMFLLVDLLPEHIQKTFGLDEHGKPTNKFVGMQTIREGESIPKDLDFALILYHAHDWHAQKAVELVDQLKNINERTFVYRYLASFYSLP